MELYFLTTSLNLSNIMSSNSVSPQSYYTQRQFGDKYFYDVFLGMVSNAILLSKYPLDYDSEYFRMSNKNEHPMLVKFDTDNNDPFLQNIGNGYYLYYRTVHLNPKNFKIYFETEDILKRALSKATMFREVKYVTPCRTLFIVKERLLHSVSLHISKNIFTLDNCIQDELEFDRFVNAVTGFLLGIFSFDSCFFLDTQYKDAKTMLQEMYAFRDKLGKNDVFKSEKNISFAKFIRSFERDIKDYKPKHPFLIYKPEKFLICNINYLPQYNEDDMHFISCLLRCFRYYPVTPLTIETEPEFFFQSLANEIAKVFGQESSYITDLRSIYKVIYKNATLDISQIRNQIVLDLYIVHKKKTNRSELALLAEKLDRVDPLVFGFQGLLSGGYAYDYRFSAGLATKEYDSFASMLRDIIQAATSALGPVQIIEKSILLKLLFLGKEASLERFYKMRKQKARIPNVEITCLKSNGIYSIDILDEKKIYKIKYYSSGLQSKYRRICQEFQKSIVKLHISRRLLSPDSFVAYEILENGKKRHTVKDLQEFDNILTRTLQYYEIK